METKILETINLLNENDIWIENTIRFTTDCAPNMICKKIIYLNL